MGRMDHSPRGRTASSSSRDSATSCSFIEERGAHAGPSEHEMHTFFIHPAAVIVPGSLSHPIELYAHFAAYGKD